MLLQHGATPDATASGHGGDGGWEWTPIYTAYPEQPEIAEMLFQYGHSLSKAVHHDWTPGMPQLTEKETLLELVEAREMSTPEKQKWLDLVERARRGDLDCETPNAPLLVQGVDASSTLKDESDPDRYSAAKAFDGNPKTAWVEDVEGGGEPEDTKAPELAGESISITFNQPLAFDAVEVMPGYFKGKYWKLNNRVKELHLWEGQGEVYIAGIEQKDEREAQTFELDHVEEAKTLTFEIRSVYEGERWDDTAISEIALYRNGERIELKGNLADAHSPVLLSKEEWK